MKKNPLREYLLRLPKSSRRQTIQKIAKALGVTEKYIYMMHCGIRPVLPKYAVLIEKVTNKELTRQRLFPQLYE